MLLKEAITATADKIRGKAPQSYGIFLVGQINRMIFLRAVLHLSAKSVNFVG